MEPVSHRGPGSLSSFPGSLRASRASSRSRISASAREVQQDADLVAEVFSDALIEPTPLAPWRQHEGTGESSAEAEAVSAELADRAASATMASLPARRATSTGPWRGTRPKRSEGPSAPSGRDSLDMDDAQQPPLSPTHIMASEKQPPPPSSQAFLMDPNASLGPPSSGELRIQAALQGPVGLPTALGPGGPAIVAVDSTLWRISS